MRGVLGERWLDRVAGRFKSDRKGQVSILVAASSVAIMSAVGGNIDASTIHVESARLQHAVDAAALHALREVSVGDASDAGASDAVSELLAANFGSAALPPDLLEQERTATKVLSREPARLTVTAIRMVELPFGVLGGRHVAVSRTAQAVEAERTPLALLLLDRTASAAWSVSGSSKVVVSDGAAVVNSSSPAALDGRGGGEAVTDATLVAGPQAQTRNWTPAPRFNAAQVSDPFMNKIRWPADTACDHRNMTVKKEKVTLQPGVYCGGLKLETHAEVTLAPGVYVLKDGPLLAESHSVLNGPEGVTIVITGETAYTEIRAGSQVTLRAPKTGDWKDIAIATKPQSSERTSTLIGGGELVLDGVLYFPTQKVVVTGGGAAQAVSGSRVLVANRLETRGNGEIRLRGAAGVASIASGGRLER